MTRALLMAILLLPVTAWAQEPSPNPTITPSAAEEPSRLTLSLANVNPAFLSEEPAAAQAQAQAPALERRRRRPSMVGYINDAGIQSQVRLRFDVGKEVDAADRAEFFYPKCGCYRDLPVDHPAFDPEARGPGPGIVTDLSYQQFYVQAERAFGDRISLYGELPIRWLQPQAFVLGSGSFGDQSGISDLRAGLKLGIVDSDNQLVTLQLQGNLPTGDGRKGLGVEHFSFEPALLYNGSVSDRVHVEGQLGFVLPTDGSEGIANASDKFAGNVLYYGIGPSVEIYRNDDFSFAPVVELVGWRVLSGFQTATSSEADGVTIVNLKLGGRFEFRDRNAVYVGYGQALTDDAWYHHLFRMEYRYTF